MFNHAIQSLIVNKKSKHKTKNSFSQQDTIRMSPYSTEIECLSRSFGVAF